MYHALVFHQVLRPINTVLGEVKQSRAPLHSDRISEGDFESTFATSLERSDTHTNKLTKVQGYSGGYWIHYGTLKGL